MKNLAFIAAGVVLITGSNAYADRKWDKINDPSNFETNYNYNFARLPTSGNLDDTNKGWSDSYWPATYGYIADRWQQVRSKLSFMDYALPSGAQVSQMTPEQLNLLSPAEKFDIIRGRLDFPIATELKKGKNSDVWWKGLCGGWTTAALNFDEPKDIVYQTKTGLKVPLASSDIKGMLAYYYANMDISPVSYIGASCRPYKKILGKFGLDKSCDPVNAASFHVVMANELGMRKKGFAMDREPGPQTWNQAFVGYTSQITSTKTSDLSKDSAKGTVKEVYVTTTVKYVNELYDTTDEKLENDEHVAPSVKALGKGNQHYRFLTYNYVLDLDAHDQIIGGEWTGDELHPDMIWKQRVISSHLATDTYNYRDDWSVLADIVKKATQY